jgi:hypothetical protein
MWHSNQKQTKTVEMRRNNHTGNQRRELKIFDTLSKTVCHKILSVHTKQQEKEEDHMKDWKLILNTDL